MVWVLRVAVASIVALYAGWVAWPLLAPFDGAAPAEAWRASVAVASGAPSPHAAFWIASILFYLASALLTLFGSGRAPLLFLIGFMVEVLLRLTINQHGPGGPTDVSARALERLAPLGLGVDPGPLTLAAVAILGLVVCGLDQWRAGPTRRSRLRSRPEAAVAEPVAEPVGAST